MTQDFVYPPTVPKFGIGLIIAKMAAATAALEEAIKEYLLFRGFTETLKNFEAERKGAKEKEYKVGMNFAKWHKFQ